MPSKQWWKRSPPSAVFTRLDRLCRPNAVLASNTSSLRIAEMAEATLHQERVIGLHFFNPVPKMPLVEVVRAPHSDDLSLATAIALAGRIGKTPILVNDAPGFVVNRVLIPYLTEAMAVAQEGGGPRPVDRPGHEAMGHADGAVRIARRNRAGYRRSRAANTARAAVAYGRTGLARR